MSKGSRPECPAKNRGGPLWAIFLFLSGGRGLEGRRVDGPEARPEAPPARRGLNGRVPSTICRSGFVRYNKSGEICENQSTALTYF